MLGMSIALLATVVGDVTANYAMLVGGLAIGAMTLFMNLGWERYGGWGLFGVEFFVKVSGGKSIGGLSPAGVFVGGSVFCAAAAPIIGTIVLNREMTANEVYRSTLTCFLGPAGWFLANAILPPESIIGRSTSQLSEYSRFFILLSAFEPSP